jgi:hypothetical protein
MQEGWVSATLSSSISPCLLARLGGYSRSWHH